MFEVRGVGVWVWAVWGLFLLWGFGVRGFGCEGFGLGLGISPCVRVKSADGSMKPEPINH